jgi:membrane-associated phospholipid phosphatase
LGPLAGKFSTVRGIDYRLFEWINGWSNALNPFLKFFSVALNVLWVKALLLLIIFAMLIRGGKARIAALLSIVAVGIANTLTNVCKEAGAMSRPFQDFPYRKVGDSGLVSSIQHPFGMLDQSSRPVQLVDRSIQVMLRVGDTHSPGTASAHSANMAAVAFAMTYCLGWKWGFPWIVIALLTGLSRVYTGAHYPTQVLLGWLCGVFAAWVVIKTWEAWQSSRKGVESNQDEEAELA